MTLTLLIFPNSDNENIWHLEHVCAECGLENLFDVLICLCHVFVVEK